MKTRPRLVFNVDQATKLGVLELFTDKQCSANMRDFYVDKVVIDGFVALKHRVFCTLEGHAFKGHELRLKLRAVRQ